MLVQVEQKLLQLLMSLLSPEDFTALEWGRLNLLRDHLVQNFQFFCSVFEKALGPYQIVT